MNSRLLTFIALFTITIGGIGVDLYSPSLPWIAQYMEVHQAFAKYTITTYLIGFAIGQLVFGIMADIHGRKWILLAGIFLFVLSSFIAVFSVDIYILMVMRCIQGFGAASCSVISKTLLTDALKKHELRKALTTLGIAWALGPIVAPIIGSYLQYHYQWQANFYFYTIYSFALLLTVLIFLKETLKSKVEAKVSTIITHYGTLLKHRAFITGAIVNSLGYSAIIAFNIMGPFLVQRTLHYSPVVFGYMALIVGFAYFFGSIISRLIVQYFSVEAVINMGLLSIVIFGVLYVVEAYSMPTTLWTLMVPTFLIMASFGLILPTIMVVCMSSFPQIAGISSSMLGCVVYVIATMMSSLFSLIPLSSQRPYAWALLYIIVVITGFLLLGFFPAIRRFQEN